MYRDVRVEAYLAVDSGLLDVLLCFQRHIVIISRTVRLSVCCRDTFAQFRLGRIINDGTPTQAIALNLVKVE